MRIVEITAGTAMVLCLTLPLRSTRPRRGRVRRPQEFHLRRNSNGNRVAEDVKNDG